MGGNLGQQENKNICFMLNYKLDFEIHCDPDGDMACIFFGSIGSHCSTLGWVLGEKKGCCTSASYSVQCSH